MPIAPTPAKVDWLRGRLDQVGTVERMVCQLERAPKTGTPHIQGVVVFKNAVRWSSLREALPCYWAKRRGTQDQAEAYARKLETRASGDAGPFEFGDPIASGPGGRTDIVKMKHQLAKGVRVWELAKDDAFTSLVVRNNRGVMYLDSLYAEQREWWTKVQVYWGPPDVGKTRRVRYETKGDYYMISTRDHTIKYWDGYRDQKYVLIDDFNGELTQGQLLELINYTPFSVQVRGASVPFLAEKIFITSNYHPREWWNHGPNPQPLHVGLEARFGLRPDARFSATATEEMTLPWAPTALQLALWPEPALYQTRTQAREARALAMRSPSPAAAPVMSTGSVAPLVRSSMSVEPPQCGGGSVAVVPAGLAASRTTRSPRASRLSFDSLGTPPFCASELCDLGAPIYARISTPPISRGLNLASQSPPIDALYDCDLWAD